MPVTKKHPPCEVCGGGVGQRGHRCTALNAANGMCWGTYLRAKRILKAGVDANGATIDDDEFFRDALKYSIETKNERTNR